jgi:hypothetical protein
VKIKLECIVCGESFERPPYWVARGMKACSRACGIQRQKDRARALRSTREQPTDSKIIFMSRGLEAYVSNEDYGYINSYLWCDNSKGYAMTRSHGTMHRMIMRRLHGGYVDQFDLDHINGNKLDNRRENLRAASRSENTWNRHQTEGNSHYLGVHHLKSRDKYSSYINVDGVRCRIGNFADEDEAAWMRDQYAIELHGDFASLNFTYEAVA